MARAVCAICERAKGNCICDFVTGVDNEVTIVVLQHPSESKQNKATLPIIAKSLKKCHVIVGENFTNNQELNKLLLDFQANAYLLYPTDGAIEVSDIKLSAGQKPNQLCLVVLDGTWKKAYKMYQLSDNLQQLPALTLPAKIIGQYQIRKTQKENALSTLEACCYGLMALENNHSKYQIMLDNFVRFNQQQLSFIPLAHQKSKFN
ncbi:MAG: tRNA-uridine aminocarboxypropyltransferase [Thalassotalea sp.]